LIADELDKNDIHFVELRGDTTDRTTPIAKFQNCEVPVFLISLKAGGTGLNLTAADTVIHYDPWWNPAVEEQATDRAHRIGQTKNVFVYKLIAQGTIEQRMVDLQDRKRNLAKSILDKTGSHKMNFSEQDLEFLLAPIE
jgi:SNF2 family DNA or RNA helicase